MKKSIAEGINFKKAFLVFFAALLIFSIVSAAFAAVNDGWSAAVEQEQTRREARSSAYHGEYSRHNRTSSEARTYDRRTYNRRGHGQSAATSRLLQSTARTYVRATTVEFDAFNIIGSIFRIIFVVLIILWVYVSSKKPESLIGRMIARKNRKRDIQ